MNKYALLVRMNPEYWPSWESYIQPNKDARVWFKIGRRIPQEITCGLPVIILGTKNLGILATGETVTNSQLRTDPDWAEVSPTQQEECKEVHYRVQISFKGLQSPIPIETIRANSLLFQLPKTARETVTWLSSEKYNTILDLITRQNQPVNVE
ncbi:MAG: hypothetical protein AB7F20_04590 [Geoalkalibacter sp.]|uniref:hypothetical protein n=1 Tax=Geoalkalibacter sp. TaxID=3041440 RepID=UPI003D0C191D